MFGYSSEIDWEQFSERERATIENLPHGSGIDCDWFCEKNGAGKVVCYNSYHCMDEFGYYDGYADFSVRWVAGKEKDFRLMFHGVNGQYLDRKYQLREYLEDTFYYNLESVPD